MKQELTVAAMAILAGVLMASTASANRYTSPNYIIDAGNIGASISAITEGGSYRMVASGGESIVGSGQGGSYKLDQGYVAQLPYSLELTVSTPNVTIPIVTPGVSQTGEVDLQVISTSPEYTIAINQSSDLTNGSFTIPAISGGTIASPIAWDEGITTGLGMTLSAISYDTLPAKWSSGNAYAALPGTASSLYTRTGIGEDGGTDTSTVRYRLDVAPQQESGEYTNTVTYTATWIP